MVWRAALIGCGKIGSEFADDPRIQGGLTHAEAYAECPATELVAVADVSAAAVERCGARWGVTRRDTDPLRMLAEVRPEIVSVCSPDGTHHAIIRAALRTPGVRAVLAEKPLAMTPAEARELVTEAAEKNIPLAVNYSRRYATGHAALQDTIRAGRLGRIQRVSGYYTKGTLHNGTHWFDLVRCLVGEVEGVQGWDVLGEAGEDPTLDARLCLADGTVATLAALDSREYSLFEMDIVGTAGRAQLVDSGHWIEYSTAADSPYYSGYRTLIPDERVSGGLENVTLRAVEDLVRCLETGGTPACSGHDGLRALEIGFALHSSAKRDGALERCLA